MQIVFAAMFGVVFGLGLLVAGMSNPAKVLGFLDIAGQWDPSLAFVMVGAICVGLLPMFLLRRMKTSLLGLPIQVPWQGMVDRRLVLGSGLFGVGWGLGGICPGPAVVGAALGRVDFLIFVMAMLAGMALYELNRKRPQTPDA
ncbi:MAG: YeeE/YedE family protein [Burkholderiales bacterium]|nr:YeeE/YedE family protein [Burkholderiales bacterium]